MKKVLVLHAPADAARAHEVSTTLEALGYAVSARACNGMGAGERRQLAAAIHTTPCTLVLWSHAATPGLRAAAGAADRRGRLALARLDTTPAPARLGGNAVSLPRGRSQGQTLRRFVEDTVTEDDIQPFVARTSRGAALFTALALSLVAASAAYFVVPSWAAQVNAIAGDARSLLGAAS